MGLSIDEIVQRRAYNAAADLVDGNVARGLGGKVAFTDPERTLTYGALQAQSCRFARALKTLGIRQESRLALLLLDTVDFPVAFFGAIRGGVVALPLNILLTESQYAYVLADSRACAIVVQAALAKPIAAIVDRLPELRTVILIGATPSDKAAFPNNDVHLFEDVLAHESGEPCVAATNSDEVAFWMYTSGSTGDPKGVKHVQTTPAAAAALMGQTVIGINENDVVFSAAKLFFSYGMGNALAFPMSVGGSTILWPHRPTPDAVFDIMQRHNPTVFYGVPTLYASLLAHKDMAKGAGSNRLRLCVSAGEALPMALGERWRAVAGCDVVDGIGSTEMFQTFLSNRPGDVRYGSTGKPVAGYELRIVDENGRDVADGEIGEIAGARSHRRRRLLESAQQEPPHFRGRMDSFRRQVLSRRRRLLLLLRTHRRHVQGLRHVGVAVRSRSRPGIARSGVRSRRHRQRRRRRIDQAEGVHRAQGWLHRRRQPARKSPRAREGTRRPMEVPALDRRARRPPAHRHWQASALQAARPGLGPPVTDFIFRRQFAIEWGHCDPAGIVFNSRFFEFFDRSAWLMFEAALGVPPHELSKTYDIVGIPLVGSQAKFLAPAKFGDVADMELRIVEMRRSSFDVEHKMFVAGTLSVEGLEKRVWAGKHPDDPLRMKARPIPDDVIAKFKNA